MIDKHELATETLESIQHKKTKNKKQETKMDKCLVRRHPLAIQESPKI